MGERESEVTAPAEGEKRKRSTRWPEKGENCDRDTPNFKKQNLYNFLKNLFLTRGHVPDLDRPVQRGRDDPSGVAAEAQVGHLVEVGLLEAADDLRIDANRLLFNFRLWSRSHRPLLRVQDDDGDVGQGGRRQGGVSVVRKKIY